MRSGGAPEPGHFSSDGVDIAFIDVKPPRAHDPGEPILLIHGFASSHRINWVNPRWVETLTRPGAASSRSTIAATGKAKSSTRPPTIAPTCMTRDAANLLAHLGIERADVMGYSMGARIASFLALGYPSLVRSLVLGGLGDRLMRDAGLPEAIAEAMEAPSLDSLADPTQRMFRAFAEQTKSDRAALAACARGFRRRLTPEEAARIAQPALVAVGERDAIAGDPSKLVAAAAARRGASHPRPRPQSRGRRQGVQGRRAGLSRPPRMSLRGFRAID